MPYLIDGYNLLFAYLGAPPGRKLSKALERGRNRLLELVRTGHGGNLAEVTVVFDAAHAPAGVPAEADYQGIHVVFAVHEARADDEIVGRIRTASAPRRLTVVSDDHYVQQAARRRHCSVLGCTAYLHVLDRPGKAPARQPGKPAGKPQTVSPEETQRWLGEFAELEHDPAMRELADPHGFGDVTDFPC